MNEKPASCANFMFKNQLLLIVNELQDKDIQSMSFLAQYKKPSNTDRVAFLTFLMETQKITPQNMTYLGKLLKTINAVALAQRIPPVENEMVPTPEVCPFRLLLFSLAQQLSDDNLRDLKFLCEKHGDVSIGSGVLLFAPLMYKFDREQLLNHLIEMFETIHRNDLVEKVLCYIDPPKDQQAGETQCEIESVEQPEGRRRRVSVYAPQAAELVCTFSVSTDELMAKIDDLVFVSDNLLLLTDRNSSRIKLFDIKGKMLDEKQTGGPSCRLARLSKSQAMMVDKHSRCLQIVDVSERGLDLSRPSQKLSKQYWRIVKLSHDRLAASESVKDPTDGVWGPSKSVDILDLEGQIQYSIATDGEMRFMCSTKENSLVFSDWEKVYKTSLDSGNGVFAMQEPELHQPCDLDETLDGSLLVCNCHKASLALCTAEGEWVKDLWVKPPEDGVENDLIKVSVLGTLCACANYTNVYVLRLVYE